MMVARHGARKVAAPAPYGRWLALTRPQRNAVALCLVMLLAEAGVALMLPSLAGQLARSLYAPGGVVTGAIALLLALLVLARAALGATGRYLHGAIVEDVVADLRSMIYRRLQAVSLDFYDRRSRADLLCVLTNDVQAASRGAVNAVAVTLPSLALCLGAGVLLVRLEPGLGGAVVLLLPLTVVLGRLVQHRVRPVAGLAGQLHAEGAALAETHLRTLRTAKALGAESELARHFDEHRRRSRLAGKRAVLTTALIEPAPRVTGAVAVLLVLWAVSGDMLAHSFDAGGLVAFLLYGYLLVRPLGALVDQGREVGHALAATRRVEQLLAEPPEASGDYVPRGAVKGRLALHEVGFGYPGRHELLSRLSLDVEPGELVAVTGPSGIGKTTLLNLVMGYVRPSSGAILLDGVDTREWNVAELRRHLSLVPSEVEFLPVSVRSNITLGAGMADAARLDWALEVSAAHEVVRGLTGGLEARLGPGGAVLSPGQSQRLALARALYKRTPVLLLDDAAAMFDEQAEGAFVQRARSELRSTTVLMVTHRARTLALADRVLRLGAQTTEPSRSSGDVIQGPWRRR